MPESERIFRYGQKFTEDIKDDWGGKVYEDLMAVVDHVATLPYADPDRMAAAGGSYGGYMVDWMLGHTQRFKAFIFARGSLRFAQHVRRNRRVVVSTVGVQRTPWDNPGTYEKWSPSKFREGTSTPLRW